MRAMGLDDADIGKPMIGVVSQNGENTPCNMTLGPQADAARLGVAAGGGHAVPFTTISVSDGIGDEPRGHAHVPGLARADRRLDRGGGARPRL